MPATVTTKEIFPLLTPEKNLIAEVKLRIKAGAIRSWFDKDSDNYVLYTEWNVLGEQ
jgi:hypothetical protein